MRPSKTQRVKCLFGLHWHVELEYPKPHVERRTRHGARYRRKVFLSKEMCLYCGHRRVVVHGGTVLGPSAWEIEPDASDAWEGTE